MFGFDLYAVFRTGKERDGFESVQGCQPAGFRCFRFFSTISGFVVDWERGVGGYHTGLEFLNTVFSSVLIQRCWRGCIKSLIVVFPIFACSEWQTLVYASLLINLHPHATKTQRLAVSHPKIMAFGKRKQPEQYTDLFGLQILHI